MVTGWDRDLQRGDRVGQRSPTWSWGGTEISNEVMGWDRDLQRGHGVGRTTSVVTGWDIVTGWDGYLKRGDWVRGMVTGWDRDLLYGGRVTSWDSVVTGWDNMKGGTKTSSVVTVWDRVMGWDIYLQCGDWVGLRPPVW